MRSGVAASSSRPSSATTSSRRTTIWPSWGRSTRKAGKSALTVRGRLASAGRRAFARGDANAAGNLLRRAVTLLQKDDPRRLPMLPELGEVLLELGEFKEARTVVDEALETARRGR